MSTSTTTSDHLIFDDITRREISVNIDKRKYILIEANGEAVIKWRNSLLKATKLGANGRPTSLEGIADSEPYLVSLCLFYADADGKLPLDKDGEPDPKFLVPVQKIRKWPNRIQKTLFDTVKDISQLNDEETVESLEKQKADLEERLAEKRNQEANGEEPEDSPKN